MTTVIEPLDAAVDGDASTYLEELLVGELPEFLRTSPDGSALDVEVVGSHIRLSGSIRTGHFRRLSDFLNNHQGLIALRDATILRRNGDPTKVTTHHIWLNPSEITLVGQAELPPHDPTGGEMQVAKVARSLIVVTPGHTLTGKVFLMPEADLSVFIESVDPTFIPMTDVRTRSLADRRVISRYAFAMLNRRHIVATTEMLPGMAPVGRSVL
ncbi:hypothetical protein BH20CHL7_BH20CHL7_07600 [soil metagenome]